MEAVGDVVEVPVPPAVGNATGGGGARNNLITPMEAIEVGEEVMSEVDEVEAEEDEAEGGS